MILLRKIALFSRVKLTEKYFYRRCVIGNEQNMVRVLNVAEKNDAAKNLANIMSRGASTRREGFSKFNKIYEFQYQLQRQNCHMVMTSVSGHLLEHAFSGNYKNWQGCNPITLFDAPVQKKCPDNYKDIMRTLQAEAAKCQWLVIWTDCDREGENIGFEIIQVCKEKNPNLRVFRARFSEITPRSIAAATQNLAEPDKKTSDAVEVRIELDLRIGAAFTRFQTLRLQRVFPNSLGRSVISYGSCQFPTLGFVVERYKAIQQFVPESFWKIKVTYAPSDDQHVDFSWKRVRVFDELTAEVLCDKCQENNIATVTKLQTKPKSKWRPVPLDTIELEKMASRKLGLSAKATMTIAERLYTQGYISYPRTETNIYPKELNLRPLIEMHTQDQQWGAFAQRIIDEGGPTPRQGKKSDQAHPPIHPTKHAVLQGPEGRVYEFVVRSFLACCHKDAQGFETVVEIDIAGEQFVASGLQVTELNYLEVYPYQKWTDKSLPNFTLHQQFTPNSIGVIQSETSPPSLLTEADLIALMEKHGIGTDATHAEHIEKIKDREYVGLQDGKFLPAMLGMGLVEGYETMGLALAKPHLRAELEADLQRICEGTRQPADVLREQVTKYRQVFEQASQQVHRIDEALGNYYDEPRQQIENQIGNPAMSQAYSKVFTCRCGVDMVLKRKRDNQGFYVSCMGYPECRNAIWLPNFITDVVVSDETCPLCENHPRLLDFTVNRGALSPFYPDQHRGCIGGCDSRFMDLLFGPDWPSHHANQPRENAPRRVANANQNGAAIEDPRRPIVAPPVIEHNASNPIVCFCNEEATLLTVRKEGPNQGRKFYKCGKRDGGCNFFLWEDDASNQQTASIQAPTESRQTITRQPLSSIGTSNAPNVLSLHRDGEGSNVIVCSCNESATLLTVRKEGPNQGRQFYKCGKRDGGCNFFLWEGDQNQQPAPSQRTAPLNPSIANRPNLMQTRFDNADDAGDGAVQCQCNLPAKRLTVQKAGPNQGRDFYCCSKPRETQCRFFEWADATDGGARSATAGPAWEPPPFPGPSRGRGRGRGGRVAGGASRTGELRAKRKCGICKEEGHNRNNCPMNPGN